MLQFHVPVTAIKHVPIRIVLYAEVSVTARKFLFSAVWRTVLWRRITMRLFQEGIQVRDSTKKAGREGEKDRFPRGIALLFLTPLILAFDRTNMETGREGKSS